MHARFVARLDGGAAEGRRSLGVVGGRARRASTLRRILTRARKSVPPPRAGRREPAGRRRPNGANGVEVRAVLCALNPRKTKRSTRGDTSLLIIVYSAVRRYERWGGAHKRHTLLNMPLAVGKKIDRSYRLLPVRIVRSGS